MAKDKTPKELFGNEKYPLIDISKVEIVERPPEGKESEQLFFNPRRLESFTPEEMEKLYDSIRQDGLQQPIIVRVLTKDGTADSPITAIQLIAGERRFRTYQRLYKDNVDVYDDQLGEMRPSKEVCCKIPCKVHINISDEKALQLSFTENYKRQDLSVQEEIELVDRLLSRSIDGDDGESRKMTQQEVANLLGTNVTWVNQTIAFKDGLPKKAYKDLLSSKMSRNVAVDILSYPPEKRQEVYTRSVVLAHQEWLKKQEELKEEENKLEDEEEVAESDVRLAEKKGDKKGAGQAAKRQRKIRRNVDKVRNQRKKIEKEGPSIKSSHVERGAQGKEGEESIRRRSERMSSKKVFEDVFMTRIKEWIENGKKDEETGNTFPPRDLQLIYAVCQAILRGDADPADALREHYIEIGKWSDDPAIAAAMEEDDDFDPYKEDEEETFEDQENGYEEDDDFDNDEDFD